MFIKSSKIQRVLISNIESLPGECIVVYIDESDSKINNDSYSGRITIISYSFTGSAYFSSMPECLQNFIIKSSDGYIISKMVDSDFKYTENDVNLFRKHVISLHKEYKKRTKEEISLIDVSFLRAVHNSSSYNELFEQICNSGVLGVSDLAVNVLGNSYYDIKTPETETERYQYIKKVINEVKNALMTKQ